MVIQNKVLQNYNLFVLRDFNRFDFNRQNFYNFGMGFVSILIFRDFTTIGILNGFIYNNKDFSSFDNNLNLNLAINKDVFFVI